MAIVDTIDLKYEVQAEYPYSKWVVDTEEEALDIVAFEKATHHVTCTVRVVGEKICFDGVPEMYMERLPVKGGWASHIDPEEYRGRVVGPVKETRGR